MSGAGKGPAYRPVDVKKWDAQFQQIDFSGWRAEREAARKAAEQNEQPEKEEEEPCD